MWVVYYKYVANGFYEDNIPCVYLHEIGYCFTLSFVFIIFVISVTIVLIHPSQRVKVHRGTQFIGVLCKFHKRGRKSWWKSQIVGRASLL